jgi:hypothetical protein
VLENRVMRIIFGSQREEIQTGENYIIRSSGKK